MSKAIDDFAFLVFGTLGYLLQNTFWRGQNIPRIMQYTRSVMVTAFLSITNSNCLQAQVAAFLQAQVAAFLQAQVANFIQAQVAGLLSTVRQVIATCYSPSRSRRAEALGFRREQLTLLME
jgi:hypothetical protein